mgnify:CR=1 FL=1
MTVTFFGHRRTPDSVKPLLKETLRELIEKDRADMFYVGNEGSFDWMVYDTLKELKTEYPFISYKVVLAYLEKRKKDIKNFSLGNNFSRGADKNSAALCNSKTQ